jgi:pimeloyl-ACP methyl ester carboxylesterase
MQALLVHGMGRTPLSMWRLGAALRRADVPVEQFGYVAAWQPVDAIVHRLERHLARLADREYLAIGHSLGGLLLLRAVALVEPAARPAAIVMLGTPHRAPRLAQRFARSWWYRLLNGDAGELLASPERMRAVPVPLIPLVIIAGTGGPRGRFSPFGHDVNDGIVAMSEVVRTDATVHEVGALHPFLMNQRVARALILARATRPREDVP